MSKGELFDGALPRALEKVRADLSWRHRIALAQLDRDYIIKARVNIFGQIVGEAIPKDQAFYAQHHKG